MLHWKSRVLRTLAAHGAVHHTALRESESYPAGERPLRRPFSVIFPGQHRTIAPAQDLIANHA